MDTRSASYEKLRYTCAWGVPAVSADWLYTSIQTGQKKPFGPYIIRGPGYETSQHRQSDDYPRHAGKNNNKKKGNEQRATSQPEQKVKSRQIEPVDGDGFLKTRKPNPTKHLLATKEQQVLSADDAQGPESSQSFGRPQSASRGLALSGFLKQVTAKEREPDENNSSSNSGRRKRLPLKGRANSATDQAHLFSRASSIDTLNDDGSAVESVNMDAHSRPQSLSLLSGGRLDLPPPFEDEDDAPAMTQLGYEDPDAVAARREFLQSAGRISNDDGTNRTSVDGVKGLENVWGVGRRTRHKG